MKTEPRQYMGAFVFILSCLSFGVLVQAGPSDEPSARDATLLLGTHADAHLSGPVVELWKSPAFQKRFAESYLAETDIEPPLTESERDKMMKVLEFFASDKTDDAVRLLQKNINDASSAVFEFTLANIYFQRDQLEAAAALYEQAVEKYPKFRRAWKHLGLAYVQIGEKAKALPTLTKVIELGGGDVYTYGMLGVAYASVEDYLSAESAFRMAILLDPATLDWKFGLADSLARQERYAEVVSLCDRLIADDPNRADLWLSQANAYIGLNQPIKAAINYEFVDRLGQSTVASLCMLGDIYVNEELFGTAVDAYIRAIQMNPHQGAERTIRAAKVLTAHGALEDTKRLIEAMETLQGNYIGTAERKDLLKLRARIAVAEGSGEEEIRVLEEIVSVDPLDGEALILLGQHTARAGDFEKAVFYYERAESLEAYEADAKVRHAQLLVGQGKYTEALPLLRRAQNIKPRDDVQKYLEQVERVAKSR